MARPHLPDLLMKPVNSGRTSGPLRTDGAGTGPGDVDEVPRACGWVRSLTRSFFQVPACTDSLRKAESSRALWLLPRQELKHDWQPLAHPSCSFVFPVPATLPGSGPKRKPACEMAPRGLPGYFCLRRPADPSQPIPSSKAAGIPKQEHEEGVTPERQLRALLGLQMTGTRDGG